MEFVNKGRILSTALMLNFTATSLATPADAQQVLRSLKPDKKLEMAIGAGVTSESRIKILGWINSVVKNNKIIKDQLKYAESLSITKSDDVDQKYAHIMFTPDQIPKFFTAMKKLKEGLLMQIDRSSTEGDALQEDEIMLIAAIVIEPKNIEIYQKAGFIIEQSSDFLSIHREYVIYNSKTGKLRPATEGKIHL
jgi:hypothetical protein